MSGCNSTSEGHADTIGKQLANIKGKGVATLKRVAEASEGRIVMRQTSSGSRLSSGFGGAYMGGIGSGLAGAAKLYDSNQRFQVPNSLEPGSLAQLNGDDSISVTTTTSDVNSDDDAASIVSRLSQIVVEQEEKLLSSSDPAHSQMLIIDNSNSGDDASRQRPKTGQATADASQTGDNYHESASHRAGAMRRPSSADLEPSLISANKSNQLRPNTNRVRSLRSNSVVDQQLQDRRFRPKSPPRTRHYSQDFTEPNNRKSLLDRGDRRTNSRGYMVPEIHVIRDADQKEQNKSLRQACETVHRHRSRAQSVSGLKIDKDDCTNYNDQLLNQRGDSPSDFLPERGDLKSLELSRANQQGKLATRNRSNTSGNIDQVCLVDIKNEVIMNIRRSAWTLSDFDETFNKSGDKSIGSSDNPTESSRKLTKTLPNRAAPKSDITKQALTNSSLAEKNDGDTLDCRYLMLDNQQNKPKTDRLSLDIGHLNPDRRPSATHSIISIPTSIDSFHSDLYSFSKPKPAKRRKDKKRVKKNKDKREEGSSFSDESQRPGDKDGREATRSACVRSCLSLSTLGQYLPIVQWLPSYKISFLWGDLMAGLAVAVLNISTSLSAAVVAETDFSVAFRASIINTFVYALLCSSKHTSFGSWSIMSQMLFISVSRALSDELILARINLGPSADWQSEDYERWHLDIIVMYTFLIGLAQFACGLLNLGKILASFIPEALCSSMITATAFTMAIGQLSNMCGTSNKILWSIEKNTTVLWADLKNSPVSITDLFAGLFRWIQQIALLVKYYDQINLIAVIISIVSVTFLILNQYVIQKQLERYFKRKIFIPSELILLILMILISSLLNLRENYDITTCGPLNIDFVVPDWPNFRLIRELWFDSFATALISFTMVYIMAKTYSNKFNYEVDCNQELIACGAGNLIGGLCDALPATASFSRTAGQVEAGGQTQMASLINCVGLFVMARVLGHHVAELPVCVMAATLFYGFARMMTRFSEVFIYWRVCKVDFAIWMVTFTAILTLDIVNGFVYGFIFSILTMLYRAQNRRSYMLGSIGNSDVYVPLVKYPLAREIDGIKIFQFCGPMHYVCADLFERLLRQKTRVNVKQIHRDIDRQQLDKFNPRDINLPTHIILDFSMISYIDSAGIRTIKKIIEDFQRVNITILLASLASHVAAVVKREPSLWNVHKRRFYVTLTDAVHYATVMPCRTDVDALQRVQRAAIRVDSSESK